MIVCRGRLPPPAVGARGGIPDRFLCAYEGLPFDDPRTAERIVGIPAGTRARGVRTGFYRYRSAGRKVVGGRGRPGLDRTQFVAGESPARLVPVAGRGGYDGRIGAGRAVRARRLRNLPRLRGRLSGRGDPSRPDDRRGGAAFPAGRSKPATGTKAICTAGCSGATYAKGPVLTTAKPRSPYTTLSHRLQNWNGWTSTTGWDWTRPVSGGFSAKHRLPVRFAPPTRADTQAEVKPDGCRDVRFFACFGTKSGLPLRLTFCLITDCIRGEKNENSGPANVCRIHNKTYFCELKTEAYFQNLK